MNERSLKFRAVATITHPMSFPQPTGRSRRFGRERPPGDIRTLGADDPSVAEPLLPEPVAGEVFAPAADPFAMESAIEFRADAGADDPVDGSSVGKMWANYAAKAALGDLAG